MITDLLQNLGIKHEETKLYLSLLETGAQTAGDLSKKHGWPRPNVYNHLQKLIQKGLVRESTKANVKLFIPEAPEKLILIYQQKVDEFKESQKKIETLLPTLKSLPGNNFLKPRMQFYEGRDQIQTMLQDILFHKDIRTYTLWPVRMMIDMATKEFLRYHNKERIRRNIHVNSLWLSAHRVHLENYPYMASGPELMRTIRVAPESVKLSMCYWVYGDKVMFISPNSENFGFIIESKPMAELILSHHKMIWEMSSKLEEQPIGTKVFLDEVHDEEADF